MGFNKFTKDTAVRTRLKKNDLVVVRTGREKGKTGRVLRIDAKKGRAFVQGLAMVKKAMRKTAQNDKGGIIEKESSIHLSNLMCYSDKWNAGGRMGSKIKDGKKIRVLRRGGKEEELL